MKIFIRFIIIFTIIISGCSIQRNFEPQDQATQEQGTPEVLTHEPVSSGEYQFQIGDVFEVRIFEFPEFDQTITVRPDGRISLLLVDDLVVLGMTPSKLDEIVTEKYKRKIKDPEISIVLKEFAGQRIFIGGEVNKPGEQLLSVNMTLTQSIFQAGGFKRTAELKNVGLIRKKDVNTPEIYLIDVDKIIFEGERDVILKPYDMIFVPKSPIAKVGDFVDLYINAIIPTATRFNLTYRLDN